MTGMKDAAVYKVALYTWLKNCKSAADTFGLFHIDTENEWDSHPRVTAESLTIGRSATEEEVAAVDAAVDNYIVLPRVPFTQVKNCWALAPIALGACLVWIDDEGRSGVLYEDYLSQTPVFKKPLLTATAGERLYGVWPIRQAYLPTPHKSKYQESRSW